MRGMFKFGEEDFVAQITNVLGRLTDVEHYHLWDLNETKLKLLRI